MSMLSANLTDSELRLQAKRAAKRADRTMLLEILNGGVPQFYTRRAAVFAISAARQELIDRYPCSDCGVPAGRECKPDYGCKHSTRRD